MVDARRFIIEELELKISPRNRTSISLTPLKGVEGKWC